MLFDYETLKLIWWAFVGIIMIGFALTGGFDLGVAAQLPFVGKTDHERRTVLNAIGPTWDGNQVWLVLAGGALFAAWPLVYAVAFSGFYTAMLFILLALIIRPGGFEYRSKIHHDRWRQTWDRLLSIGGVIPALVIGVAFGNLFLGVPFGFDADMRSTYTGGFLDMLTPFALLAGVLSVTMHIMHGSVFLQLKTEHNIQARARSIGMIMAALTWVLFAVGGFWTAQLDAFHIAAMPDANTGFAPLAKTVDSVAGGWLTNYATYPWMQFAPLMGLAGAALVMIGLWLRWSILAFLSSSASLIGIILTAGFSLFPFVLPSSTHLNSSLTVWDSVSSHFTLNTMFIATVIFLPIIILYTSWVFSVVRGKVDGEAIKIDPNAY